MAKAERIEIAIFPMATVSAMIRLLSSIGPSGGAPEVEMPVPSMSE